MPLDEKPLVLSAALGGERQRGSLSISLGYSAKAHSTGKPAYLHPNRNTLQKPIGGLSVMALFIAINRPAEVESIYRGGISHREHNSSPNQRRTEKLYQQRKLNALSEVIILSEGHRIVKKNFEAEMWVDGHKVPLNHFVQETIANVMVGFSKTLKGMDVAPEKIEVKIKKLAKPVEVDAHTYP